MRTSCLLFNTIKDAPKDATLISHQLMLRSGMLNKLSSGLYSWMPLGLRVLRKVENIVSHEMNKTGAQEILMPAVQPSELWMETGRWDKFGPQLLKIKDRHQKEFCFGPTHEEVVTDIARQEVKSYKQLPLCLYQIQTKFRDEIRPRFGVMRAREFIMKDAYSFHLTAESLNDTYNAMYTAYSAIFTAVGLQFRAVLADTGAIGGSKSHEFQVLANSGEDLIVYSNGSNYAANIELATAKPNFPAEEFKVKAKAMTPVDIVTVEEQVKILNIPMHQMIKTLLVKGTNTPAIALILCGNDTLNEVKVEKITEVFSPLTMLDNQELQKIANCSPGFVGPIGLNIPIIADSFALALTNFSCGANVNGEHFIHVNWDRDLKRPQEASLRVAKVGDLSPDNLGTLEICRGIEVGHIFALGTKYSEDMHATVLDETSQTKTMTMGCYGIGVSRIVAAAIEQHHDENGIVWPQAIAPFSVVLAPMNFHRSQLVKETTEKLYQDLISKNIEVLLDDRDLRAGAMFADLDLIGIPHRIVIGERGLANGTVEYKARKTKETQEIKLEELISFLHKAFAE